MPVSSTYGGPGLIYGPDRFLRPSQRRLNPDAKPSERGGPLSPGSARPMRSDHGVSSEMAAGEREILAREGALKAAARGGSTSTTYTYATGPDGRKYIVGAEVSVVAPEEILDAMPGGSGVSSPAGFRLSPDSGGILQSSYEADKTDDKILDAIAEMERTEREVIAHEAAHKAAAGRFGGPVSYTYETGPDGKRYITGGSVPINTPATSDPEEALRNANQVLKAALAPASPSGQDLAVAASSAGAAAKARARIAAEKHQPGESEGASGPTENTWPDYRTEFGNAVAAYTRQISPKGLWTSSNGYETRREHGGQEGRISGTVPLPPAAETRKGPEIKGEREREFEAAA